MMTTYLFWVSGFFVSKKCSDRGEIKSVCFIEPLHKPEDDIQEEEPEAIVAEKIEMEPVDIDIETGISDMPKAAELPDIELIEEPTLF